MVWRSMLEIDHPQVSSFQPDALASRADLAGPDASLFDLVDNFEPHPRVAAVVNSCQPSILQTVSQTRMVRKGVTDGFMGGEGETEARKRRIMIALGCVSGKGSNENMKLPRCMHIMHTVKSVNREETNGFSDSV
jgi:hypothetical protein